MPQKTFSVQFVSQGVARVQRQMKGAGKAGRKAGKDIEKAGRKGASSMDSLRESAQGVASRLKRVGTTLTATLTPAILGIGGAALKASADMERQTKALEAVMGSAEAAEAELARLRETANAPGIGVQQAIDASLRLQVVGQSADEARNLVAQFGNAVAASGGSAEDLDEVTRQFSQILSVGKLTQENLGQITERAPGVAAALQSAFGAQTAEAINEQVGSMEEFTQRLTGALEEAERVEGGLGNAFDNVRIQATQSLAAIGDSLSETFEIQKLVERFTGFMDILTRRFVALPDAVQRTSFVVAGLAAVVGPLLIAVGALTSALAAVSTPVLAIVGGLSALGAALAASGVGFSDLKDIAIDAWEGIKTAVMPLIEALTKAGQALIDRLTSFWERWGDAITGLLGTTWDQLTTIITGGLRIIGGILDIFVSFITGDFAGAWTAFKGVVVDTFKTVTRVVLNALQALIQGTQALAEQIPLIGDSLGSAGDSAVAFLEGLKPQFAEAGREAGEAYTTSLQNQIEDANVSVPSGGSAGGSTDESPTGGSTGGSGVQSVGIGRVDGNVGGATASGVSMLPQEIEATRELTEAERVRYEQQRRAQERQRSFRVLAHQGLQTLTQSTLRLGSAIGDSLTSAIFEGKNAFEAMGKAALSIIKDLIAQLVSAVAKAALLTILTGGTSAAANAGGLTGAIGGLLPAANGAIVSGPTAVLAGEYNGARTNPEVIAPLDKLQSMLPQGGGGRVQVTIEPKVLPSGDLTFAQRAGNRRRRRTGNA